MSGHAFSDPQAARDWQRDRAAQQPPRLTDIAIMKRAVIADDAYAEMQEIISEMRADNLAKGGDDRFLGQLLCAQLAHSQDERDAR